MTTNNKPKVQMQSNSLRGAYLKEIMDRTVDEIDADISPMLGPGASDAVITKDGQPYYTRDGKEVMESLTFNNELANYIHHFLYQAAYHQGREVGDGSTTLIKLYCSLYKCIRDNIEDTKGYFKSANINSVRNTWKMVISDLVKLLETRKVPLTEELLYNTLCTCTQDEELSNKIFDSLKDAIMAGAYIVPRKSNIATDFNVTTYHRPLVKVTRQFSLKPMTDEPNHCVIFYCNGMLNLAHAEVLAGMSASGLGNPITNERMDLNLIILAHGVTERTRETVREFTKMVKNNEFDLNKMNNVAIYTMDDYRTWSNEEIEDISTILTDEPGIGGLVQPITFEAMLYKTFVNSERLGIQPIEELEYFDADLHLLDKMKNIFMNPYKLIFDDVEGMAIDKPFGPVAHSRYEELRKAIDEEKSPVKKVELNKRLRRTFGMFIDVEVGSTLLKDSQRKFELILDALISTTEAARSGVLIGNSLLHALDTLIHIETESDAYLNVVDALTIACHDTIWQVIVNYGRSEEIDYNAILLRLSGDEYPRGNPEDFNLAHDAMWPIDPDPDNRTVVEPFSIIKAILENSILPVELAKTEVFHISGARGFMGNYID